MTDTQTREIEFRAAVNDAREITGIGVPYGEIISIWGQREMFAPGSVRAEGAKLLYRHADPIGSVTSATDDDAAWAPTAKISATQRGDEAYQLARDGVLDGLSVGFTPTKWHAERDDQGEYVVYDEAIVREVSLVPFPAYPSARVQSVRHEPTNREEPIMTDTQERADQQRADQQRADDMRELRETVEDVQRSITVIRQRSDRDEEPVDHRTAGEVLKAIVAGDDSTIREYNDMLERAYTGGTTADAIVKDGWVGDLTRLFDASSGVLVDTFSTGTLPQSGNNIEYGELDSNTITVTEQAAEGDDIPMGKVKVTTKTAPVKTYAGGTELSRQEIERATVNVLNTNLNALALAAGARKKAALRAVYNTLVTARIAIEDDGGVIPLAATLAASDADDWENALIDAAIKFDALSLTLDRMLVSGTVFKRLRALTVSGERVFQVAKDNSSGTLSLPGLSGNLAGLDVRLDTGKTTDGAEFVNKLAVRAYDSPLVSLSDEKISNLTKQFAVYRYGAVAAEIPAGVVPVTFAAA